MLNLVWERLSRSFFNIFYSDSRFEAISYTGGFRQLKTALCDRNFSRLDYSGPSYRQSSRFYSFCALPRGG